ncbi:serine/threonine-protein kinase [Sphaerisporangium rhizosphaerae]|uniref:non-specific serine/threonine protein kinase n=1 Tax=Sphaerisporangium rhizosphaerae TaxID=2269375 RepID=A0ABW2PFN1_9ACTN
MDSDPRRHRPLPGYTEIRELGTGAAGRVVMARDDADGELVAIRHLSAGLRADANFLARLRHDALGLEVLDEPSMVGVHGYFESADGSAAIVMELVDGVSLRTLLRHEEPTGPEAALVLLNTTLSALAAAHANGIMHRDVRPENILVSRDGHSKLGDFGIPVHSGDGIAGAGTPSYMAPEQWSGAPASAATDIYAAAVVFYECLTGTRPFHGRNVAALAHLHQTATPSIERVPQVLRPLVTYGLAKQAADRPAGAEAFLAELEQVADVHYGPGWEHRGLLRLASLVKLLGPVHDEHPPSPPPAEASPPGRGPAKTLASKAAMGLIGLAAAATATTMVVRSLDGPGLQAHTTFLTPRPVPSDAGHPRDRSPHAGAIRPAATHNAAPSAQDSLTGELDTSTRPGSLRRTSRKPPHAAIADRETSSPVCVDVSSVRRPTPAPEMSPVPASTTSVTTPASTATPAPADRTPAEPAPSLVDETPD